MGFYKANENTDKTNIYKRQLLGFFSNIRERSKNSSSYFLSENLDNLNQKKDKKRKTKRSK